MILMCWLLSNFYFAYCEIFIIGYYFVTFTFLINMINSKQSMEHFKRLNDLPDFRINIFFQMLFERFNTLNNWSNFIRNTLLRHNNTYIHTHQNKYAFSLFSETKRLEGKYKRSAATIDPFQFPWINGTFNAASTSSSPSSLCTQSAHDASFVPDILPGKTGETKTKRRRWWKMDGTRTRLGNGRQTSSVTPLIERWLW